MGLHSNLRCSQNVHSVSTLLPFSFCNLPTGPVEVHLEQAPGAKLTLNYDTYYTTGTRARSVPHAATVQSVVLYSRRVWRLPLFGPRHRTQDSSGTLSHLLMGHIARSKSHLQEPTKLPLVISSRRLQTSIIPPHRSVR